MITRRFGRTGLDMPVFSCGGMRFQQAWKDTGQEIEPEAQAALAETVGAGLALGVNHIETARGYGTSERQLGMLLRELDRDSIILQTKIAPTPDPADFAEHFAESLQRLCTDRVDLLSLHGINTWEKFWWAVRPGGCLARARQFQAEGRVGSVGLSTHGTTDLIVSALEHDGDGGFDYVNLHWYFITRRHQRALDVATERDIGVFIISPSDKGGRLYEPPATLVDLCAPLSPLVFNNAWCLSNPQVHTLSLGAARPSDFDPVPDSLAALADPQLLAGIEERLAEAMREAVGVDHPDELWAGLPDFVDAPGFVNLRVITWLRGLVLGWGMTEYATGRYRMLGNASDWFPGLNAAHAGDLDLSRAVRESPFAADIPTWLAETHQLLGGSPVQRLSASD
ncbi:MAG: aldo/keto reductase [Candidatus Nanopelagicales bacterium]